MHTCGLFYKFLNKYKDSHLLFITLYYIRCFQRNIEIKLFKLTHKTWPFLAKCEINFTENAHEQDY